MPNNLVKDIFAKRAPVRFVSGGFPKPGVGLGLRDLDRTLVKYHSEYTRLKLADPNGRVRCFTCSVPLPWRRAQEGHFVPRGKTATKFRDRNTHPQCERCNVELAGNLKVYAHKLDATYGVGTADRLKWLAKHGKSPARADYVRMIEHYKLRVRNEKRRIGI